MIINSPAIIKKEEGKYILEFLDSDGFVANTLILSDLKIDPSAKELLVEKEKV